MGTHMKTTVEIAAPLLKEAKKAAAQRGTTLRRLVEEGLRRVLENESSGKSFHLRKASFKGKGLGSGIDSWEQIRDAAYEGRGA